VRQKSRVWSLQVWPAAVYAVGILIAGSLPAGPPGAEGINDKVQHFFGFGLFAGLCCRALRHLFPLARETSLVLGGFCASVLLGGLLEIWQSLLSYRSCDVRDWIADVLGAAVFVSFFAALRALGRRRAAAEAAKG
jgi:VanZ family protein